MDTIIAEMKLNDARHDLQHHRFGHKHPDKTNYPVSSRKGKAKDSSGSSVCLSRDEEKRQTKKDVREVVSVSMMMFIVTAGNVKKSENAKGDVKQSGDYQN